MNREEISHIDKKLRVAVIIITLAALLSMGSVNFLVKKFFPDLDVGILLLSGVAAMGIFSVFFFFLSKLFYAKQTSSNKE